MCECGGGGGWLIHILAALHGTLFKVRRENPVPSNDLIEMQKSPQI